MKNRWNFILLFAVVFFAACGNDDPEPPEPPATGTLEIRFKHVVDSVPLGLDTLMYQTEAGNLFKVTDLRYFISAVKLNLTGGGELMITSNDGIHYVNMRMNETMQWFPADKIPASGYDSISFIFGLDEIDNESNRFPDPPERDMFWPEILGGGYHYMQLNTMWKNPSSSTTNPFMLHLGIGQLYSGTTFNTDSIIGYVHNHFGVLLPSSSFTIDPGENQVIEIVMHIDQWFNGPPNTFDLSTMPQGIMQNQPMMSAFTLNGRNLFTVTIND